FFAIMGAAALLLLAGCEEKGEVFYQNPYRIIVDYQPSTFTINGISGNVTPDDSYDWITSNGNGSFTVRRNTTGKIRRAEFTVAGSKDKAVVNQKAHSLDAKLSTSLLSKDADAQTATFNVKFTTEFPDDYESWGYIFGTENDPAKGKEYPQGNFSAGDHTVNLTGVDPEQNYFFWGYALSTEGDKLVTSVFGLAKPVQVRAGEDLQKAIDGAQEFSEIRVQGGAVFNGTILFDDKNKNKTLTGGWNEDFTEQSWDNLTVIDGGGVNRGIYCGESPITDMPLQGSVEISYFEIRNCLCLSGHGSAIRVSGGPVTVHHCYIHHNEADRGTINTREDDQSSDITVYDCVIVNNVANGHAAGVCVEDGQSRANPTHAKFYGNIIANNRSIKNDGYAGSVYFYQSVDVQFVNNTVINNFNYYEDNGNWWGNFYLRGNTNAVLANNLILRPWGARRGEAAFLQDMPIEGGGARPTAYNNIIEGEQMRSEGSWIKANEVRLPSNFPITDVLKNPDVEMVAQADLQNKAATFKYNTLADFLGDNYMSQGKAVGAGTVETLSYNSHDTANLGASYSADIKAFLEKIGTDINGNPFLKNGKVDIGALQSK
ncbi:MAG: hypothetical protein IJK32_01010, partial [Bacteroidales bacterium]|nr:hypothetical protein [Bacteroidales bacterium]